MANQYKNKVVYYGETLIDISEDTVTADKLLAGYTAHDKSGAPIVGSYTPAGAVVIVVEDETDEHGGTVKKITGVDISRDTVTAEHLEQGYTAHDREGNAITGVLVPGGGSQVSGDKLLWREGTFDVAEKETATYIWPFPVRAYINTGSKYWGFYNDSSTSFCFGVKPGKTYTISWDDDYTSSLYRIAFTKSENVPSYTSNTSHRINVYDSQGNSEVEQNGFVKSYSFTVGDSSIKTCVIQLNGTSELWTNGTIRSWFLELMSHLTITVE